ncbi:MAG: hypothetical protein JW983_05355 [Elusimicrobia bacterium]|nr:hypothetical protein [Elusimicrobiota bacterium]
MKKILSLVMITMLAATAYAFVPLTNTHEQLGANNANGILGLLGSYQRGATRGMFYNELDIISAAPVELLDFSGNCLYTQWGNVRNWNDIANYGTALNWTPITDTVDTSFFTLGVTGNPFSYLNIEDSRSGIVFQNYGAKVNSYDLGNDGGNDSEGNWKTYGYTVVYATVNPAAIDQTMTSISNAVYWENQQVSQWNVGTSYKLNSLLAFGISLAKVGQTNTLKTEGQKSYSLNYNTSDGALNAGRPASATYQDSLVINYPTQEVDNESEYMTDILPQARLSISDSFHIDCAAGLRVWTRNGVDDLVGNGSGNNKETAVTVSVMEDVVMSTAAGTPVSLTNQYWMSGTAIVSTGTLGTSVNLDWAAVTFNNATAGLLSNVMKDEGDDLGITEFSDDRSGSGPLFRLEAVKKFEKVDVIGVFNFDNVSHNIDAKQVGREYIQNSCVISTWQAGNIPYGTPVYDNYVEKDITRNLTYSGKASQGNMDIGAKIAFKAMEGVKLSIGGYVNRNIVKANYETTLAWYERCEYDDGYASTDAWSNTGTTLGVTVVSSGSIGVAAKPGAITANDNGNGNVTTAQGWSRGLAALGNGMNTGAGEGKWEQSINRVDDTVTETITTTYGVPVGVEIPLSKKWTFRAGTEYQLQKTETTTEVTPGFQTTLTTVSPANGETVTYNTAYVQTGPTESVSYAETHMVSYTYGVQFDPTPSLSIACNAFLDTNMTAGADASGTSNANFLDLATYRLLSLSAAFKF